MKDQILIYINTYVTHDIDTKAIATKFKITMQQAYNHLNALYQEKKIEKLEPLNGNNLNCCDWLKIQ